MRISDWSSYVCSSDLGVEEPHQRLLGLQSGEQGTDALEIGQRGHVLQQMGVAAHDERAAVLVTGSGGEPPHDHPDRKSVVQGQIVSDRLVLGGCRTIIKKTLNIYYI